MAVVIIARLFKDGKQYGFRILDTYNSLIKDMEYSKARMRLNVISAINFNVNGTSIVEINGDDDNYPIIDLDNNKIIANKIIIIKRTNNGYTVTDAKGSIRDVTNDQMADCDKTLIANIHSYNEIESLRKSNKSIQNSDNKQSDIGIVEKKEKNFNDVISGVLDRLGIRLPDLDSEIKESNQCISDDIQTKLPNKQLEKILDTIEKNQYTNLENKDENGVVAEDTNNNIDANENIDNSAEPKNNTDIEIKSGDKEYILKIRDREDGARIVYGILPEKFNGDIEIPEGVTHIDDKCFMNVPIESVKLPSTLKYIGEGAFSNTLISEIELPSKIDTIPHGCFARCDRLTKLNFDNINTIGNEAFYKTALTEVHIKSDLAQIGINAFKDCLSLNVFTHRNTIRKIRKDAFLGCKSLDSFDFKGVIDIEEGAFCQTNLETVELGPDVKYILSGTFTSHRLTNVSIAHGGYKIGDSAFMNLNKEPITYTLSKEITNIGYSLLHDRDTVRCYHGTVAESMAREAECTIEYLDDGPKSAPKILMKAFVGGISIEDLISELIQKSYDKSDVEYEYDLDEKGLYQVKLDKDYLDYLGIKSVSTPTGYEERPKFKLLLDHYRKNCQFNGFGLSKKMIRLRDTFDIDHDIIYDDGISRIYNFNYSDHKFESKKATMIVAMTGDTVRYCCLHNKSTDLYCRTSESKDLHKLISVLMPGDVIGYECVINGKKCTGVSGKYKIKKDNTDVDIPVNLYQALFRCSITVKLNKNFIAMILPADKKVIMAATIGGSVWNNENEKSYKERKCTIMDIQDLENNTIFENNPKAAVRDDRLFKELYKYSDTDIENRIKEYSTIGKAKVSPYIEFRNYCITNNVSNIEDLDLDGLNILMSLPIIEEKTDDWLDTSLGKTIVDHSQSTFELSCGSKVYQYTTMKRVAMRNKLLTGGDRSIYVFEICDALDFRQGIYACNMDLREIFNLAKDMIKMSNDKSRIYKNPDNFDIVRAEDFVLIAAAFVTTQERQDQAKKWKSNIWLTVYKPNGLYYICYFDHGKNGKAIPLIQVGDIDIVTDYIDCATTKSSDGFNVIYGAGLVASCNGNYYRCSKESIKKYDMLLEARKLAIKGVRETKKYIDIGIPAIIAHMFGTHTYDDSIYDIPVYKPPIGDKDDISLDIEPDSVTGDEEEYFSLDDDESNINLDTEDTADGDEEYFSIENEDELNLDFDDTNSDNEISFTDEEKAIMLRQLINGEILNGQITEEKRQELIRMLSEG